MVDFGVHPFIWTSAWTYESVPLIERAQALGFTAMDIPVRRLDDRDVSETKAKLEDLGIQAVAVAAIGNQYDLTSQDGLVRRNAIHYIQKLVTNSHGIGATILGGVFYAPIGKLVGRGPSEAELSRSAEGLREVARFAQDHGVKLAMEPVSRYETYLINTVDQGLEMVERVGEPNVGLLLDTYHMNVEEKDFYRPIASAGERLFHCHACENDRGIPGTGLVHWDRVFQALRDISYQGVVSIESFVSSVPEIAASTCIWRSLAPDGDTLAREGLAFLRTMAEQCGLAV